MFNDDRIGSLIGTLGKSTTTTTTTTCLLILSLMIVQSTPSSALPAVERQRAKIPIDRDRFLLVLLLNRRDLPMIETKIPYETIGIPYSDPTTTNNYNNNNNNNNNNNINAVYDDNDNNSNNRADEEYTPDDDDADHRTKRIGSLSIVNSVDVLRQRVLLELARRKAMEDQRQISENRRLLDSMGKRSVDFRTNEVDRKKKRRADEDGRSEVEA